MTTTLDLPFQLGDPRTHAGITIAPLFPRHDPVCDYVALDEALAKGLEIGEVHEAGIVGELAVRNPLDRGVLLYDGEELVGAKQNRILNVSVLLAAGSTTSIPVSCVERGRWAWRGRRFGSAGHVAGPELRRRKAAPLRSRALARGAAQAEVWAAVDAQLAHDAVPSATSANADRYMARRPRIDDLAARFPLQPGQCGAVVATAGGAWCLDAVSRPAVFAALYPKLVAGYFVDAGDGESPAHADTEAVLSAIGTAAVRRAPSVALGEDLRLDGKEFCGSGLSLAGELVQLSAYGDASWL